MGQKEEEKDKDKKSNKRVKKKDSVLQGEERREKEKK